MTIINLTLEFKKSSYPYPWNMIDGYLEFQDIGVSNKELCLGVYENEVD